MSDLEQLRAIDEAYRQAGEATDQKCLEMATAHSEEGRLGEERAKLYKETLAGGFIIKKVINPKGVGYQAGYFEPGGLFGSKEKDEPSWIAIDKSHAKRLAGAFATGVSVELKPTRSTDDIHSQRPQPDLQVNFEVSGVHDNEVVIPLIHRDKRDEAGFTLYIAELAAIEWRLPTEEEVQAFGSLATTTAQ